MAAWTIEGQYMETCNCAFLCPCITSNLTATPTEGDCKAAIAMRIDRGRKDGVSLDGIALVLLIHSPGAMAEGDFTVGLIVDEGASDAQVEQVAAIISGEAGGPMAALAPLVGNMVGIERRPVVFEQKGLEFRVEAGDLIEQRCEGLPSAADPKEPIYLDNVAHPVASRLALGKATSSRFHAFGIDWDDETGARNAHFAPFSWAA